MSRHLRPLDWSLLGIAALLTGLIALMLGGGVHSPQWLPAPQPRDSSGPTAVVKHAPTASLDSLSNTWKTPLFSPDRSPDPAVRQAGVQATSLTGLTLTGVIIDGDTRVALLKQSGGKGLKVRQGDRLPNGWTLEDLGPMQASFGLDGRLQVLRLPAPRLPPPSTTPPITLTNDSTP
jgi:general secretion pathway protein N